MTALVKLTLDRSIRRKLKVHQIEVVGDGLDRLRELRGERCLLTPSHSGGLEPHVVMHLSKLLNEDFYYVAALEVFERSRLGGWLMQRLGAYSIIRGAVDRPSFQTTRKILAEGKHRLVIFPEGEAIWQNSVVMPFQPGVVQLAFKGLEDARKADAEGDLICVPIAIKYSYLRDMRAEIDASLWRLEAMTLDVSQRLPLPPYERMRRIAEAILVAIERTHDVKPPSGDSFNDRIQALKLRAITRMERQLEVQTPSAQPMMDRVRTLFNTVDRLAHELSDATPYEQQLAREQRQTAQSHYDGLWRMLQFAAIYDGYVSESMTVERFMDVLCLMEMEVFKVRRVWGPRQARVAVGEPVSLGEAYESYKNDKRGVAQQIALALESAVRSMLDQLGDDCPTVRLKQ
ncbi:MAG: lysophospholipid acyltransferase family protein [Planctomycetota bacterium]